MPWLEMILKEPLDLQNMIFGDEKRFTLVRYDYYSEKNRKCLPVDFVVEVSKLDNNTQFIFSGIIGQHSRRKRCNLIPNLPIEAKGQQIAIP